MKKEELKSGIDARIATSINRKQGSKQHPTVSAEEAEKRRATGKTQGAKGAKMSRINLAFTPDNYEFIKRFCHLRGENMTDFTNHIIEAYRKEHLEEFEKLQEFIKNT